MRARWPTLALFSLLTLGLVAVSEAARRADKPAAGTPIAGAARVSDGDTLSIAGERIRIHGIDAPEQGQLCASASDPAARPGIEPATWKCGTIATRALAQLIAHREVACEPLTRDLYGRIVARCMADGLDLGAEMVRQGMAWAFVKYSSDYVALEREARARRIGIWQAATATAWDYRASRWQTAEQEAPGGCSIKGNVTWRGERIYHMPWSPWYASVRMDAPALATKGKRWFCSETEALAAGWRPSAFR